MSATNSNDKLVRMANQIAAFFRPYPEDEAVAGVRKHLKAYWTPKMRQALADYAPEAARHLDSLVVRALEHPTARASPARKPAHVDDEIACDAG